MNRLSSPGRLLMALALLGAILPVGCAHGRCGESKPARAPDGTFTGYATCGHGVETHRTEKLKCAPRVRSAGTCMASAPTSACSTDADCRDKPNGFCVAPPPMRAGGCQCDYGCITDADCASGRICECGVIGGTCVEAKCSIDSDCESGLCLSVWTDECIVATQLYACVTSNDECATDEDCREGACRWTGSLRRCMRSAECGVPSM